MQMKSAPGPTAGAQANGTLNLGDHMPTSRVSHICTHTWARPRTPETSEVAHWLKAAIAQYMRERRLGMKGQNLLEIPALDVSAQAVPSPLPLLNQQQREPLWGGTLDASPCGTPSLLTVLSAPVPPTWSLTDYSLLGWRGLTSRTWPQLPELQPEDEGDLGETVGESHSGSGPQWGLQFVAGLSHHKSNVRVLPNLPDSDLMLCLHSLLMEPSSLRPTTPHLPKGLGVQAQAASKTSCRGHPWHSPAPPGFSDMLRGPGASDHPPCHAFLWLEGCAPWVKPRAAGLQHSLLYCPGIVEHPAGFIKNNSWDSFHSHPSTYLAIALESTLSAFSGPTDSLGAGLVTQHARDH